MFRLTPLHAVCIAGALTLAGCANTATPHTSATHNAVTLQSHHWQLQQAFTAQGQAESPALLASAKPATVGLQFAEDHSLYVDRLCNSMRGSYQTEGMQIQIGRMASTLMACNNPALEQLERQVAQQLPQAQRWHITGDAQHPVLELVFDNGARWQLQGTPTMETLYGPSQQIFLEIAPQTVPCNSPATPSGQCLQVREVQYNAQGLQTGKGPWSTYHGSIQGYTHQAGERAVLRLKRYTRPAAPQDASRYLDVLDLRVESEIVR